MHRIPALSAATLLLPILTSMGCASGEDIEYVIVSTQTGTDSTDQDIFVCFDHPGSALQDCHELETDGNDFEVGQTNRFEIELDDEIPTASGIHNVAIEDRGGGFLSSGWELVGLEVRARLDDDSEIQVCLDRPIQIQLDAGQRYDSPKCK